MNVVPHDLVLVDETDERLSQTGAGVKHHGKDVGADLAHALSLHGALHEVFNDVRSVCVLLTVICIS